MSCHTATQCNISAMCTVLWSRLLAVCCSVLQCFAEDRRCVRRWGRSRLQRVAACCSEMQWVAVRCNCCTRMSTSAMCTALGSLSVSSCASLPVHTYAYICICMCVMYIYMHIYMWIFVMYIYMHIHMWMCVRTMCMRTCVHIWILCVHTMRWAFRMRLDACTYICIHICECVSVICTCAHVCICKYSHHESTSCASTHVHIYAFICEYVCSFSGTYQKPGHSLQHSSTLFNTLINNGDIL